MTILVILGVIVVLVALIVPLSINRRRRGSDLEPPRRSPPASRPPAGRPPGRPSGTRPAGGGAGTREAPSPPEGRVPVEVPPALETAIEAALERAPAEEAEPAEAEPAPEGVGLAAPVRPRFRDRLGKARALFSGFLARTTIDQQTWDELEEALIRADVGVGLTTSVLDDLRAKVKSEGIKTPEELVAALKADLKEALVSADRSLRFDPGEVNVWLFVGVNGVGKTTTIGKVGYREAAAGRRVVMAAGDTFRAAAAEQLELWSARVGADLVRGSEGGDPGAVIFDAVQRAASKHADLVLGDTAGRLHTKTNLMEELKKVRRVSERPPGHLTEVLLVIDATTGQNGLTQAKQFAEAVDVTGVVLTKLDGTAKGGIALAIQTELGIPIKLVGLGETADDLTDFDPDEFVEALLAT